MIYFIQIGRCGPIKIGESDQPAARLAALQTASPYPLKILKVIEGDERFEAELHVRFAVFRMKGEWFKPCAPLMAFIETLSDLEHAQKIGNNVISFRVNDEEMQLITQAYLRERKDKHETLSSWVRRATIQRARMILSRGTQRLA